MPASPFMSNAVPLAEAVTDPFSHVLYQECLPRDTPDAPVGFRAHLAPVRGPGFSLPADWRDTWYPDDYAGPPDCEHAHPPSAADTDRDAAEAETIGKHWKRHQEVTPNPFCPLLGAKMEGSARHSETRAQLWRLVRAHIRDLQQSWEVSLDFGLKGIRGTVQDIRSVPAVTPDIAIWQPPGHVPDRAAEFCWFPTEGPPALALEVTEDVTHVVDYGVKQALYARLGVREYWILDPWGDMDPMLQGWQLTGPDQYEPILPLVPGLWLTDVLAGGWWIKENFLYLIR